MNMLKRSDSMFSRDLAPPRTFWEYLRNLFVRFTGVLHRGYRFGRTSMWKISSGNHFYSLKFNSHDFIVVTIYVKQYTRRRSRNG